MRGKDKRPDNLERRRWMKRLRPVALVIVAMLALMMACALTRMFFLRPSIDPPGEYYDTPPSDLPYRVCAADSTAKPYRASVRPADYIGHI